MPEIGPGDHLVLIDGSSFIHRAYHALPRLTRRSDGMPVGAVSGFCAMLWRLLKESSQKYHFHIPPTHLAVVMDAPGRTFRHELYPDYKAHRGPRDPDLTIQFPVVRKAIEAFNVGMVEEEGFEADDVIGTFAMQAVDAGAEATIVASDKDLMQLIQYGVTIYDTMAKTADPEYRGRRITREDVITKFGVGPEHVIDFLALTGDTSDNVPGVPKVGPKTAADLINRFGGVEEILDRLDDVTPAKLQERLRENADLARLSKELVTLNCDVPTFTSIDELAVQRIDPAQLLDFLEDMELPDLAGKIRRYFSYA
jgi:DNA polymerase-1